MKINNKTFAIILLIIGLSFSVENCKATAYNAKPLENLEINTEKAQTVSFNYRIFNKADCKKFLGREQIIANGYQPIQIAFTNNSDAHFLLSLTNFSNRCLSYEEVAQSVRFNTALRVGLWAASALIIWPFIIPAITESIDCPKANEMLNNDFYNKALVSQIVKPFSTIDGIIFISKKNFNNKFSFTISDIENNKKFILATKNLVNDLKKPINSIKFDEENE